MQQLAYNPAYTAPPLIATQMNCVDGALNFVGDVVVNGVNIPLQVLEQLRQAGITAVSWLSSSELQDAVQACKLDGTLIDDPQGNPMSLRDRMQLTHEEQQTRRPRRKKAKSYAEQILEEREGKKPDHDHDEEVGLIPW